MPEAALLQGVWRLWTARVYRAIEVGNKRKRKTPEFQVLLVRESGHPGDEVFEK